MSIIEKAMVKYQLNLRGLSMADIGRQVGVNRSMVSQVISGGKRSPKVERALARVVGIPARDLFPPRASRARNTTKEG